MPFLFYQSDLFQSDFWRVEFKKLDFANKFELYFDSS